MIILGTSQRLTVKELSIKPVTKQPTVVCVTFYQGIVGTQRWRPDQHSMTINLLIISSLRNKLCGQFEGNPMGREQKTNKESKKTALRSQKEKKALKKAKKDNKAKIVSDL